MRYSREHGESHPVEQPVAGNKVVVGTKADAPGPLAKDHAYVVLAVFDDGGQQRVRLYNPWGREEVYSLADLWRNIDSIHVQGVGVVP